MRSKEFAHTDFDRCFESGRFYQPYWSLLANDKKAMDDFFSY
jgi:hypothetical protein